MLLNMNKNVAKNGSKTITCHIQQNTGYKQNNSVAAPLLTKNWCFHVFLKETLMLNKAHTFKTGPKQRLKTGFERQNKTKNQKIEGIEEEHFSNVLMLFFS